MERVGEKKLNTDFDYKAHGTSTRSRLVRYGPLVVWAILIFIGSSSALSSSNTSFIVRIVHYLFPGASPETLGLAHFLFRKAGHLTEYAIFAWLAARAFRMSTRDFLRHGWFWAALILTAAYASSDEFHQSFVPTRGASVRDVMIDVIGGLIGLAVVSWRWRRTANRGKRQTSGVKASVAT